MSLDRSPRLLSYPSCTTSAAVGEDSRGVWSFVLFCLVLLLCSLSLPRLGNATTVVPVSDRDLVTQAVAIVVGSVERIESQLDVREHQIVTHITLTLDEVLKGDLPADTLTLKQMGGSVGSLRSWLHGSPEFVRGEKVLLFLSRNPDGTPRVLHLYQGKFSVFTDRDTGVEFAYRNIPYGVRELAAPSTTEERALARGGFVAFAKFKERLRSLLAQTTQPRPVLPLRTIPPVSAGDITAVHQSFTYLLPSDGIPIRWFEPDSGLPVTMQINVRGDPNVPGGGFAQVRAAYQAWSGVANSSFRYQDGGLTTTAGFALDGVNAITFGDPTGMIDPPVNCSGTLAVGGPWFTSSTFPFNGRSYHKAVEGDIVFNDGWEGCRLYQDPNNLAEVATHELGHVLGLGHSTDPAATMYAFAHLDGRGAVLHPDDVAGLLSLYPVITPGCSYTISPTRRRHAASGGSGTISVTASSNCAWTATSNVSWITVIAGASGTGNGTVSYSVEANPSSSSRTGTLTVAGRTFTVTQTGQRRQRFRQ
ncbi:MAG: matrixin family metalloprotease [Candidatus Binatia bacterium]|nr:matrixin family metalloprotease [Candidatus Binatia bacterium]